MVNGEASRDVRDGVCLTVTLHGREQSPRSIVDIVFRDEGGEYRIEGRQLERRAQMVDGVVVDDASILQMTTREQTCSTTSRTCELKTMILPSAARPRTNAFRTRAALTSSPENGSSSTTIRGL